MQFQEYPKWVYSDPTDAATGVLVQNAEEEAALNVPAIETKTYDDGTTATGPAPDESPAAKRTYNRRK